MSVGEGLPQFAVVRLGGLRAGDDGGGVAAVGEQGPHGRAQRLFVSE